MIELAFIIGTTLMYSTPLIYAALGGLISEKSGITNIGLEGMMTVGAFVGAAVAYFTGNPWLAFLAAGLGGGLIALMHGIISISFKGNQIISGIAINFIGPGIVIFYSRLLFNGATQTKTVDFESKLPKLFSQTFEKNSVLDLILNQYATVYIVFILAIVIWFIFNKTKLGLRIIAVGEYPKAADTLGINVSAIRYLCVVLSGVFAGFGGATVSIAIASNFNQTIISGQGYIAIATMIFGKWNPIGTLKAGLIFGFAQAMTVVLGTSSIDISPHLISMFPYILTLVILIIFKGKASYPASLGKPYEKGNR